MGFVVTTGGEPAGMFGFTITGSPHRVRGRFDNSDLTEVVSGGDEEAVGEVEREEL